MRGECGEGVRVGRDECGEGWWDLTGVIDEVGCHGRQETGVGQEISQGGATPRLLPLATPLGHREVLR